ncbi:MAG: alpha/beta hydrolase [Eubacteriales bacterium]
MAINKIMRSALKALSYPDIDLRRNYKADRVINRITHPAPLVVKYEDRCVPHVGAEDIPVRIFQPLRRRSDECMLFIHGGGWVSGDIESYARTCNNLANSLGRRVISVEYRLAPEHKFPDAPEDCYAVARELDAACRETLSGVSGTLVSAEFSGEAEIFTTQCAFPTYIARRPNVFADLCPTGFTVIGDSAGGNLTAVVSLMARDRGEFEVREQVLLYPATHSDHSETSRFASIRENGRDYLLTSKKICDYMSLYIRSDEDMKNPYFAPYLARTLARQPRTLIITAEFDPLRDEGEAYGRRLRKYGGDVTMYRMRDALHGFFSLPVKYSHVRKALYYIAKFLGALENGGGAQQ